MPLLDIPIGIARIAPREAWCQRKLNTCGIGTCGIADFSVLAIFIGFCVVSPESANIVFRGHFNPYLISPEWLEREKIWEPDDVQLVLGGLGQDSVRFKGGGVEWMLSFDRMMISSAEADCGTLAREILQRLPHTPVFATGANFVFQAPELTLESGAVRALSGSFFKDFSNPDLLKWSVLCHEDDVRVEVSIVCGEQGGSVTVNRHRKTESTETALKAVSEFLVDKNNSCTLVEKLLRGIQQC